MFETPVPYLTSLLSLSSSRLCRCLSCLLNSSFSDFVLHISLRITRRSAQYFSGL